MQLLALFQRHSQLAHKDAQWRAAMYLAAGTIEVEQPTMSITMGVNKSPFAGRSGAKYLTGRNIRDRLMKELETNVAMRVEDTDDGDTVLVSGRGLLHLTVLIENMRRESFELMVGPPMVIEKTENGERLEPFELVGRLKAASNRL
jgi:GTP-binding protein